MAGSRRSSDAGSVAENLLSPDDKDLLLRIWRSNRRKHITVKPSDEDRKASKTIPTHAYRFILRIHRFLVAFLTKSIDQVNANQKFGQLFSESYAQDAQYIKDDVHQSCLLDFLRIATGWSPDSSTQCRDTDTSRKRRRESNVKPLLFSGKRLITLQHEDFLSELNRFELKGEPVTPEFVCKDSFGSFLYHLSDYALSALASAMRFSLLTLWKKSMLLNDSAASSHKTMLDQFVDNSQFVVRFVRVEPQIQMMDIKTGVVGKFLAVKGHVVKARPKRLSVATADFGCQKCAGTVTHSFIDGKYSIPTRCTAREDCRSRSFTLIRPTTRYVNVQDLRLQEVQEESTSHAGRTPRQVEVALTNDLVDSCRPGDTVLVAGIVAAINTAVAAGKTGKRAKENSTYKLYIQGHSITTMSESNRNEQRSDKDANDGTTQVVYNQEQLRNITQLCHADHRYFGLTERRAFPFDLLVRSLCPSIVGHNAVKAGLLLCLLGGTPPLSQAVEKEQSIRCNSHILIVGDPGLGKSQMLLAASQLAARSVYVGGNTSSTTGLTVTLTKEERGESGIEAGALVLADQGVCCIDEFDKMTKGNQDGLLEAMEQQQVSIAKAGVVASLPARCSVIAAANPKHGSYNMSKTVAENLNMAKPILSRFDLVFILRDRADKAHDQRVSSKIMDLYRSANQGTTSTSQPEYRSRSDESTSENSAGRMSLSDRLEWVNDFQKNPLPASLVRDYIAYARDYCKPKLTKEAAIILKQYFMELRYPVDGRRRQDTVPITTRQLEALIRLCQARAKACLRDFVLKEDALDVVDLMSLSVEQVHRDETGSVDPGRGGAGGRSNRKMKKQFINLLHEIVGVNAFCSLDDLRRIAERVNCGLNDFNMLLDDLRLAGILMKKQDGSYQVMAG